MQAPGGLWQLTCCLPAPPTVPVLTPLLLGTGRDTSGSRVEAGRAGASLTSFHPVLWLNITFLVDG